jgi:hypothetical protein
MMKAYAKRLNNPFNGIVQIVASERIRASSFNGVDWELQFQCLTAYGIQYARIGRWESRNGFKPYPLDPSIDRHEVESEYGAMVKALEAARVPLPQDDHYECWLLDETDHQPLALLSSCCHVAEMRDAGRNPAWKAVNASQLQLDNTPEEERKGFPPVGYRVEQNVKQRAGQNPRAQWFLRVADGSGRAVSLDGQVREACPASCFPPLLLREVWHSKAEEALCERYLQRLSPRLLMLQCLSLESRDRVEQMASKYALEVDANFHLYPAVADRQRMTALRVEARLRRACT